MSLKAHIALGTLLGLLLGAGAVAVLSRAANEPSAGALERDRALQDENDEDDAVSPAASVSEDFRRPMRPGAARRLLQS